MKRSDHILKLYTVCAVYTDDLAVYPQLAESRAGAKNATLVRARATISRVEFSPIGAPQFRDENRPHTTQARSGVQDVSRGRRSCSDHLARRLRINSQGSRFKGSMSDESIRSLSLPS